jgi:hypothetical protein
MDYTHERIEQMKEELCQQEVEQIMLSDCLYEILMDGCRGWSNMNDLTIIECYKEYIEQQ